MRYFSISLIVAFAATLLSGCYSGSHTNSPPSQIVPQSAQQGGVSGTPAPNVHIRGMTQPQPGAQAVPMIYPDNSGMPSSRFMSPMLAGRAAGLGTIYGAKLHLQSVRLMRMSQTFAAKKTRFFDVSPSRMVYQVTTTFNSDYSIRGNHWSSGTRIFVVDAQTGKVLVSNTLGNMTVNAQAERLRAARSFKREPAFVR